MTSPWAPDTPLAAGADGGVTVMEGTSFCISDDRGDLGVQDASGLFVRDTRFLSTWRLTVAGRHLQPLRLHQQAPYSARFVLLAPAAADADATARTDVLVARERFVGDGMREDLVLRNTRARPVTIELELAVATDFGDLFEVKAGTQPGHVQVRHQREASLTLSTLRDDQEYAVSVRAHDSTVGDDDVLRWTVHLDPYASWTTSVQVATTVRGRTLVPHHPLDQPTEHAEPARRHRRFRARAPRLVTDDRALGDVLARSIDDLATLRIFDPDRPDLPVIAAGAPWFMALFGRDALLTSLMLLPVDTALASGTLAALAARMGTGVDAASEEEPGRVPHEVRFGPAGTSLLGGHETYYGSVDATPLFVLAVGELARWAPAAVDPTLLAATDRALGWMRGPGDRDGDGFIEYQRATPRGLLHQGWKDSWDGVNHADGTVARTPVALAEVQGYAYGAYLARADLADLVGDATTATTWRTRASDLRAAFDRHFWLPERGWYAVGLDRDKAPIDALTSNIGHCLWTGIVSEDHAGEVAAALTSADMWTGFGIRTLARGMGAYDPMSYHNGSVWPHDTAICVAGLRRAGFADAAAEVAAGLLDASAAFGGRLPELFSGFDRSEEPVPVPYPTACSPQAWAAAAPFLLLSTLLGLRAGDDGLECSPSVPDRLLPLVLGNVDCRGRTYSVEVDRRGWSCTDGSAPAGRPADRGGATPG